MISSDFCQKLQRSQDKAARREKGELVSSDEDLAPRKKKGEDDTDFLKHPFALKPTAPITINIPVSSTELYSAFEFHNSTVDVLKWRSLNPSTFIYEYLFWIFPVMFWFVSVFCASLIWKFSIILKLVLKIQSYI